MKLQMLNGAHSALAYLGYLGGHETIGDCVADPVYRADVEQLWRDEIIPVVKQPSGTHLQRYADQLLARFSNGAIRHRTWQIAMDGSQKLPQRLLSTIATRVTHGMPIERLALALAAWMHYAGGVDERGRVIDVRDPLAARVKTALQTAGSDHRARVQALLAIEAVFEPGLARDPRLIDAVVAAYEFMARYGARASIERQSAAQYNLLIG